MVELVLGELLGATGKSIGLIRARRVWSDPERRPEYLTNRWSRFAQLFVICLLLVADKAYNSS